jgi:hypothetical protein
LFKTRFVEWDCDGRQGWRFLLNEHLNYG